MSDIPRRVRTDQFSEAEKAIYEAVWIVESMNADVRLTDAVVLLQAARERVADYVDDVEGQRLVAQSAQTIDIFHAALQQIVLDDDREECCQDFQHSGNPDEPPACCGRPTRGFDRAQEVAHAAVRAVLPAHVDQLDDPRGAK